MASQPHISFSKASLLCTIALLLAGVGVSWLALAATEDKTVLVSQASVLGPVIPRGAGDQCVADTELMRTDHMDLLDHQRDETVIDGVRSEPFSLVKCVNCHAQSTADGAPIRIDAEGQFCESCHAFAAVKIDCFSCHAAVPESDDMIGFRHAPDLRQSGQAADGHIAVALAKSQFNRINLPYSARNTGESIDDKH